MNCACTSETHDDLKQPRVCAAAVCHNDCSSLGREPSWLDCGFWGGSQRLVYGDGAVEVLSEAWIHRTLGGHLDRVMDRKCLMTKWNEFGGL